jgi:RimJ/RimL family protein N-acetyltransferase
MEHEEIELIQLTPTEVQDILSGLAMRECRGYPCAAGDLVPAVVARCAMEGYHAGQDWFWCAPRLFCHKSQRLIVGSGCFKGAPVQGVVEIGYGVAMSCEGKGYASACVARMVEEAFTHGGVNAVAAEASVHNPASQRVLEKNQFYRTGEREDPEDGLLAQWRRDRPISPAP